MAVQKYVLYNMYYWKRNDRNKKIGCNHNRLHPDNLNAKETYTDMKNKIVKGIIAVVSTVIFIGYGAMDTATADSMVMTDNDSCLDLNTVTSYSGTAEGLQLYTEDGNGYYLEVSQDSQNKRTVVYHVTTEKEYDTLFNALENRDGKVIIEISYGTVTDNAGNGTDDFGYYRHYDNDRFSINDRVQSVFVYNPDSNYTDDILYRIDTLI